MVLAVMSFSSQPFIDPAPANKSSPDGRKILVDAEYPRVDHRWRLAKKVVTMTVRVAG
jgi:hypothetical protein